MTTHGSVRKRKIEINNGEYTVFGESPWVLINVPQMGKTAECSIIIEGSLMTYVFGASSMPINPHRFNALTRLSSKGALLPVVFTGETGKAYGEEITRKLNSSL